MLAESLPQMALQSRNPPNLSGIPIPIRSDSNSFRSRDSLTRSACSTKDRQTSFPLPLYFATVGTFLLTSGSLSNS